MPFPTVSDDQAGHLPVMPDQVMSYLSPKPGQTVVDCTAGRGGHTWRLARAVEPLGRVIALDRDPANVAYVKDRLSESPVPVHAVHATFADLPRVLASLNIGRVDRVLADLGFASNQMDDGDRGLSFRQDAPLDMRLDPTSGPTAADLIASLDEKALADVFYHFGEERLSRKIARKIAEKRQHEPITHTTALAQLVRAAYGPGGRRQRIDPATRVFQALRIAVNDELEALEQLLTDLPTVMQTGGICAIISFHSLEDRRVKHTFAHWRQQHTGQPVVRKPVQAGDTEQAANPRSRSAKLRVFQFADADIGTNDAP